MTISPRTYAGSFRKEASSLVGMWWTGHEVGIAGSHLATVGETLRLKVVQWALMLRDWDKSIPKDIIWAPAFSHAWASHYRACRLFSSLSPQRTFIVKASLNQVSVICDKEPCLKVNRSLSKPILLLWGPPFFLSRRPWRVRLLFFLWWPTNILSLLHEASLLL